MSVSSDKSSDIEGESMETKKTENKTKREKIKAKVDKTQRQVNRKLDYLIKTKNDYVTRKLKHNTLNKLFKNILI